jgi:threonine dehydratase
MIEMPTLARIAEVRERIGDRVAVTPVHRWQSRTLDERLGRAAAVHLKLELFQHTGSFKPRGALAVMLHLEPAALKRGVTAVSAGNHAIAVSYAASVLGTSAKVVMPKTASPFRIARCREYGGEVVLAEDTAGAFALMNEIAENEGRALVHPFEGPFTALGTGSLAVEFLAQAGELDAVVIPIGGGGLCGGMAAAIKALQPNCAVYGVEPQGADSMSRSLAAGKPVTMEGTKTIADSLAPPFSLPYSFELCRRYVDEVVLISDRAMQNSMATLFYEMKLAVEPAGAAATAAALGPLAERLRDKRIGLVVCGANIEATKFAEHLSAASSPE